MKKRSAFTLMELMVAILIFGFMSAAMASIYSTANRAMFQNYRGNFVKGGVTVSMRAINNVMAQATRIDSPLAGAKGNILSLAANVDQLTGCYPVKTGVPVVAHYFCAEGSNFWYNSATVGANGACACPPSGSLAGTCGNALPYPAVCGSGGSGTWVQLMSSSLYYPNNDVFSRRSAEGVNDNMAVRVSVTGKWAPTGGLTTLQRNVNFTLQSTFSVSRPN